MVMEPLTPDMLVRHDSLQRGTITITAAEYIQNHVAQPNDVEPPAFREGHGFIPQNKAQALDDRKKMIWADAYKQANILAEIIQQAQTKLLKADSSFRPIKPQNCTLADLMTAMNDSKNSYEHEKIKGAKGLFRKMLRKLGENAEMFKQFLEIVPDTQYTKPISAAFQIFLSMADRMHTVREDIFEMMSAVPEDFDDLKEELGIYRDIPDERLSERAADVCSNIFRTLQHAMRFMGENPFKKMLKSFKLDNYEAIIDTSLAELRKSKKAFRGEVKRCVRSRIETIYWKVDSSNKTQWQMLCETAKNQEEIIRTVRESSENVKREMKQELSNVALNALHKTLISEHDMQHIIEIAVQRGLELREQEAKKRDSLGSSKILKLLDFDESSPEKDVLSVLSDSSFISSTSLSRLAWIKQNLLLRKWIVAHKSASLFIDGNSDYGESVYISPLSFLCAKMANLFKPMRQTIVLSYFCGLHAEPTSGRRADARGMMMSLVGQLLLQKDHDRDGDHDVFQEALVSKSLRQGIERADLQTLCDIFEELILHLPNSWTVVCFIDMIDFYETLKRVDETVEAVVRLLKLVRLMKKSKAILFKLLITASSTSRAVGKEFSGKNRIWAPEVADASSDLQVGLMDDFVY